MLQVPGFTAHTPPAIRRRVLVVVGLAVVAISSAAVIVRSIEGMHPMAIALWRVVFAALLLAPGVRRLSPRDAATVGLAGVCLAAHFGTWFASLEHTTVMRSTVLVTLAPVWAGLGERAMGHPPRGAFWLGLAVAVPGVALMSATGDGSAHWIGDLLALVGGMFGAAYFLLGRVARRRVGIGTYASLVCAAAALALLPACLVAGIPLVGFSPSAWGLVLLLALVPQLLGHNGFNYALRYLPTATVTATTLLEPVGATLLAIAVLGELPPVVGAVGGTLAVAGVMMATLEPS